MMGMDDSWVWPEQTTNQSSYKMEITPSIVASCTRPTYTFVALKIGKYTVLSSGHFEYVHLRSVLC